MAKRIDVEDVNVYYSDFLAVEGASINIAPLSVTAFIGPSGCGKSTFLRILNRMHEVIPLTRPPGITSCIRFRIRRNVDFPQPDGPMNAVTDSGAMLIDAPSTARKSL